MGDHISLGSMTRVRGYCQTSFDSHLHLGHTARSQVSQSMVPPCKGMRCTWIEPESCHCLYSTMIPSTVQMEARFAGVWMGADPHEVQAQALKLQQEKGWMAVRRALTVTIR